MALETTQRSTDTTDSSDEDVTIESDIEGNPEPGEDPMDAELEGPTAADRLPRVTREDLRQLTLVAASIGFSRVRSRDSEKDFNFFLVFLHTG